MSATTPPNTEERPPEKNRLARLLGRRHGGILIFLTLFVAVGFLTRLALAIKAHDGISPDGPLLGAFALGSVFDLAMGIFFSVPLACAIGLAPRRLFASGAFRAAMHIAFCMAIALFLFGAVSEWLFWDEFGVRFNFIAVDYLIYTTEVIRNIKESYNMPAIFAGLAAATGLIWFGIVKSGIFGAWIHSAGAREGRGRFTGLAAVLAPVAVVTGILYARGSSDMHAAGNAVETMSAGLRHLGDAQPNFRNAFTGELAKNGQYAFVAAFWANELDYDSFYPVRPDDKTFPRLRVMLKQDNVTFVSEDAGDITRVIRATGREKKLNVIQITIESMSAEFLGCYGHPTYAAMDLTPNLDRLAKESLWFRHAYATGTRTVRGMEALSLSIPPTPGQAILRRPHCENMPTLGGVFRNHGYDSAFIYGGDGLFDNMNYFFANNGYRVIDRPARMKSHPETKVTFENAWGVSDEDLFDWAIDEADASYAAGKPFHQFVMTTSNHRPFTWPAGRIAPELGGREGAVAYTDYAIADMIKKASKKPWFRDTVFVIVADHCASVAGRRELEVRKYEIPLFIYCPAHIEPRKVDTMISQIDVAPTVLGLLDMSYVSRFFGRDALRPSPVGDHAFVSNYQKIALLEGGSLAVLKPVAHSAAFDCDLTTGELRRKDAPAVVEDAIVWYGCAASLFKNGKLTGLSADEENELLRKTK